MADSVMRCGQMQNEPAQDRAKWDRASFTHHPVDDLEPLPGGQNDYRTGAQNFLRMLLAQLSIGCSFPG
jgi:hypothetical protein